MDSLVKQVLEETGYDMSHQLVPEHVIVNTLRDQEVTLYIVTGVPEDFPFQTRTRKEISVCSFSTLADQKMTVSVENRMVQIGGSTDI
jgi:mRNA-decapping enzyme subunit 2